MLSKRSQIVYRRKSKRITLRITLFVPDTGIDNNESHEIEFSLIPNDHSSFARQRRGSCIFPHDFAPVSIPSLRAPHAVRCNACFSRGGVSASRPENIPTFRSTSHGYIQPEEFRRRGGYPFCIEGERTSEKEKNGRDGRGGNEEREREHGG